MNEPRCCSEVMYQEITKDNYLITKCKRCKRSMKVKLILMKKKDDVENFNINLDSTERR